MKGPGAGKGRTGARVGNRPNQKVKGGKALARMMMFERQRGLELKDAQLTSGAVRSMRAPARAARPHRAAGGSRALALALREEQAKPVAAAAPGQVPPTWVPLGPFVIPHGQTYGEGPRSRPSVSGRISSLAVDPTNHDHLLVASGGGGVWESSDRGRTWEPRTDDQASLAIGALAFDPSNSAIAYAGTGEGDTTFVNYPNLRGAGLLRSTDGGTTWQVRAIQPFLEQGFYDIVVDPLDANRIFAATTEGLYISTDAGVTWTQRRAVRTWKISLQPGPIPAGSQREILAACADGVHRSTNNGTAWAAVTLPGAGSAPQRLEVCHAPSNGNIAFAFAAVDDAPRLFRRAVAGGSFVEIDPPADLEAGQAFYDWFAAVAPNNPDVVYLGAIDVHRGVRQSNGDWTWSNISARSGGDCIHPDQHAIAFSATEPNLVFVGNDGGIYHSPDGGVHWESLNRGLNITEFEFLAQHPEHEAWLLGGTQDNGTLRYEGEQVWFHVQDGDGGDCGANSSDPHVCYHSFYGMPLEKSTTGGAWGTWETVLSPPPAQTYPNGSEFYPPLEVHGSVLARAGRSVYLSRDSGTTWTSKALPAGSGFGTALAIPNENRVYVGTGNGRVFRIDRVNNTWQNPVALTTPANGYISDLLVDPTDTTRLFVTYSFTNANGVAHVFRSTDGGSSWTAVATGLPAGTAVNAIEIDPQHPDTLWVALDVGVYRTTNAGGAWAVFGSGLPNALAKDLLLHDASRLLRVATQSRGIWEIPVDAATMPDVEVYLRDNVIDTGRRFPVPSDVESPFQKGEQLFWWQSPDIKVDSPPYHRPQLDDLDFESFADNHSHAENGIEFATGLGNERAERGQSVRVYVRVHNRGTQPASQVAVRVFAVQAAATWPDLPTGFWTGFPNNQLPATSPWKAVAPARTIPTIEPGRSAIMGFEWSVPPTAPSSISLLAVISAQNDSITTSTLSIADLVTQSRKCALRNVAVVNPSAFAGPTIQAMHLNVWGAGASTGQQSLVFDRAGARIVKGVLLSKRMAKFAAKVKASTVKLNAANKEALENLLAQFPDLEKELDTKSVYRPGSAKPIDFDGLAAAADSEPMVLLLNPDAAPGVGSVSIRNSSGAHLGGLTLVTAPKTKE